MKKKGFTLIELLAVIVILAVIALIATPAVLNIIEDSRRSAAESSTRNIANAAKTYYMQSTMNNNSIDKIDLSDETLKYNGEQAEKGKVFFDNEGNAYLKLYINGYCVERNYNGVMTTNKVEESECEIPEVAPESNLEKKIGDVVYYNPTLNDYCTDYVESNSELDKMEGCLKWYIYGIEEDGYKLMLDHGITSENFYGNEIPEDVYEQLNSYAEMFNYIATTNYGWNSTATLPAGHDLVKLTKFYENYDGEENVVTAYKIATINMYNELINTEYGYAQYDPGYGAIWFDEDKFGIMESYRNKMKESYSELMLPEFVYSNLYETCAKDVENCIVKYYLIDLDLNMTLESMYKSLMVYSHGILSPISLQLDPGVYGYMLPAIKVSK